MAELSRLNDGIGYPLHELTSSALNRPTRWYNEINRHRVGSIYRAANFGLISIDWQRSDPMIELEIRTETGEPAIWYQMKLSSLRFKK